MSNNESIDIKDINTTTELSQEEMDAVKGGATSGGTGTTTTSTVSGGTGTSTTSGITKAGGSS
jgi:natural product precursor